MVDELKIWTYNQTKNLYASPSSQRFAWLKSSLFSSKESPLSLSPFGAWCVGGQQKVRMTCSYTLMSLDFCCAARQAKAVFEWISIWVCFVKVVVLGDFLGGFGKKRPEFFLKENQNWLVIMEKVKDFDPLYGFLCRL